MTDRERVPGDAVRFDGSWTEFAPIAFTNLLLIIVTLGIYRFWATVRERRYLWDRTSFIDDRLEWAGTGKELFIGFLLAMLVIVVPYFAAAFAARALFLHGQIVAGSVLSAVIVLYIFALVGLARYRALRYRLTRTFWRGIRGGSDDPGFGYMLSYVWKTVTGIVPLGLLVPWSLVSLYNERWNRLSFGPLPFRANGEVRGLMGRFLLCYLAPFAMIAMVGVATMPQVFAIQRGQEPNSLAVLSIVLGMLAGYFVFGLVLMAFYAKYFRQVIGATALGELEFHFSARTWDWIKLLLGDAALVLFTLGLGFVFINYRHWKFYVTHMGASGTIDPEDLTQSTTRDLRTGEGLLEAFDMGGF